MTIYTKSADSDHTNENHPQFPKNNKDITALENTGVTIVSSSSLSFRFALIDKKLVWYGSINFLGKVSADDNSMRFEDSSLAADLIDIIRSQ